MDLITIGGIVVALLFVLAACFVIFKLLSRERTFEEAYGDNALKLLTNQPSVEKTNKKDKHKHKQKRKQSPKNEAQTKNDDKEIMEEPIQQPNVLENKVEVELNERKTEMPKSKAIEMPKKKKEKSKSPAIIVAENITTELREEPNCITEMNLEKANEGVEVPKEVIGSNGIDQASVADKKVEEQTSPKKIKKQVPLIKDITMPKVIERLKEIGEVEPEYINFIQISTDDTKAKENKFRGEIKEFKTEKNEYEKKLKQAMVDNEKLHSEMDKIMKEKKEQNDRHVVFEQTVRQKLMETVQLKEENKKLMDQFAHLKSKLAQADQFAQKAQIMQSELIKTREESAMNKKYAESSMSEVMKIKNDAENALHNACVNYEGRLQTLQAELSKDREQHIAMENEFQATKNKLLSQISNGEKQLHEAISSKTAYENKIQALQNELNREKDHYMQVTTNAENQIAELTHELEKAMGVCQNLAFQKNDDTCKYKELVTRNNQLNEEIGRLSSQMQKAEEMKATISDLTSNLDDQKTRNQDLRETNYKLMDNIKKLQQGGSAKQLTNGLSNKAETVKKDLTVEKQAQMDRLTEENRNYKFSLDSLQKQLEMVSRIAEETEREKDAKIANLEERLATYDENENGD